jgi:hypothetical protein
MVDVEELLLLPLQPAAWERENIKTEDDDA